jgi:RNA polymerase sigma-70 factor, ECF subfamily
MTPTPNWQLERYLPLLRLVAHNLLTNRRRFQARFDSEDIVQDVFVKAVAKLPDFMGQTEAELLKWLHTILQNVLRDRLDHIGAAKRDPTREERLHAAVGESSLRLQDYLTADQSSPSQQAERAERLLAVAKALSLLPDDQREAVNRRDLLGHTMAEIAEDMKRTEKAVAGLLLRGRGGLKNLMNGSA